MEFQKTRTSKRLEEHKKSNKEESDLRKEMLKKRFISKPSKTRESIETEIIKEEKVSDRVNFKELYRKTKKELVKSKSKLKKSEEAKLRQIEEIRRLKAVCTDQSKIQVELKKEIKEKEHLYNDVLSKYFDIRRESDKKDYKIKKMQLHIDNKQRLMGYYKIKIKKTTEYYKNWLKEKEKADAISLRHQEENESLSMKLKKQTEIIATMKKQISELIEEESIEKILESLYNRLNYNTWTKYGGIYRISEKVDFFEARYNMETQGFEYNEPAPVYGSILRRNKELYLVTIDGDEYLIIHPFKRMRSNGYPARGVLHDSGKVVIKQVYSDTTKMIEHREKLLQKYGNEMSHSEAEQNNVDYEYIGDFSVLIVTSINGNKYSERLRKHGIDASYIDAFEKSPAHVQVEVKKADIVLICTDSIPHSVTEGIKESSDKYQYMGRHNENRMVIRARFAAKQLNLI